MATAAEETTTRTTMQALKPVSTEGNLPEVQVGFGSLQAFELMQRVAKMFASSSIVPQRFQGNIANCAIALEMAARLRASPLMVMQNLYVVYGNPGWAAKFLIATFNQSGQFTKLRYAFQGTPGTDDWGCRAWAIEKETGERLEGPLITIKLAKAEGWYQKKDSKWQTMPEQMLRYRSGAWFINTVAPEISMGLPTDDEIHDVFDATRGGDGTYEVTLDSLRDGSQRVKCDGNHSNPRCDDPECWIDGEGETVDTETGEVVKSDSEPKQPAEPEKADAIPQYDVGSAIKALEKCKTTKALDKAWKEIRKDYAETGRELPLEVEARHHDLEEMLAEQEAKREAEL